MAEQTGKKRSAPDLSRVGLEEAIAWLAQLRETEAEVIHLQGQAAGRAREQRATWAEIGAAMGVSRQAAQKRYRAWRSLRDSAP